MQHIADRSYLMGYSMDRTSQNVALHLSIMADNKKSGNFVSNSRMIPPPWHEGKFVKDWQIYIETMENKVSKKMEISSFLEGIHAPEKENMYKWHANYFVK